MERAGISPQVAHESVNVCPLDQGAAPEAPTLPHSGHQIALLQLGANPDKRASEIYEKPAKSSEELRWAMDLVGKSYGLPTIEGGYLAIGLTILSIGKLAWLMRFPWFVALAQKMGWLGQIDFVVTAMKGRIAAEIGFDSATRTLMSESLDKFAAAVRANPGRLSEKEVEALQATYAPVVDE